MNKSLYRSFICGAVFVAITGTLLHFVYTADRQQSDRRPVLTGQRIYLGAHEAVVLSNAFKLSVYCAQAKPGHVFCALSGPLAGTIIGCLLIPVIFYTYSGILGFNLAGA